MRAIPEFVHFLFAGIGLLVLQGLVFVVYCIWRRGRSSREDYAKYFGTYEVYHFSSTEDGMIIRSQLDIRPSWTGCPAVTLLSDRFRYRGGYGLRV